MDETRFDEPRETTFVRATVFVEHESQQGIVVGSGGAMVKKIGTAARADLETLLATKVFLDLAVRVKRDWRRDDAMVERFGYGEGS